MFESAMYVITKDLGIVLRIINGFVAGHADEIQEVGMFFGRVGDYKRPSHR